MLLSLYILKSRKINFRILFYSFIALFLGISFAKPILSGNLLYIVSACIGLAVLLFFVFKSNKKLLVVILVFCLGIGVYSLEYHLCQNKTYSGEYKIVGRVCEVQDEYMVLENCKIENHKIKIIVYTNEKFYVSDNIFFSAEIKNINLYENGYFNSNFYRIGVFHYVENLEDYTKTAGKLTFVESFRYSVRNKLHEHMTNDYAEICYAVLFGDKDSVNYEMYTNFKNSGIAHLLAVSGLHIGFLSAIIFFLMKPLKNRYIKFGILFAVLLFYSFLCSFSPSVVRASLMCLILFSAEMFGREYDPLSAIGFSGIIILLVAPFYALDLGFRLSYFCVLSIFVLYKTFNNLLLKIKVPKKLSASIAVCLSTQLGILPFLINIFGEVAILSIITNLIAIPLFEVFYMFLIVGLVLTFIFPFMSFILKFCELILFFIDYIAGIVSSIPFAVIKLPALNIFITLAYFTCLFISSRFVKLKTLNKVKICSIISLVSILLTFFV